jgi:hypothetical protein
MKGYKGFFKGKKVTVVGLGLLGKGLGDVRFLAAIAATTTTGAQHQHHQAVMSTATIILSLSTL